MPVPETTFGITYGGPALETGRMPVRDLAPALLSLGNLFALSSGILHPDLDPVTVDVEATRDGSFSVHLLIDAEAAWDQLVGIFGSKEASALTNLRDAVLAVGGLFWLTRQIGLRRVEAVEQTKESGTIRLVLDDTTTIEVPTDAWSLFRNTEIRKYSREVVEPLSREGVQSVRFTSDGDDSAFEVTESDLPAFAAVEEEERPMGDSEVELYVEIVSVAFGPGHKWRVNLGDHVSWATVADEDFLARIDRGEEAFRKGDMLRCRIEIRQYRDVSGLHTDYTIIEVLDHVPRPYQLELPGEEDDPTTAGD